MNIDNLSKMLDEIDLLIDTVEEETKELEKKRYDEFIKANYQMGQEIREIAKMMKKAGLKEFAVPTPFKGYNYGRSEWLVIHDNGNYSFSETGRCAKWTVGRPAKDITYTNWWFENRKKFDEAFGEAIIKATKEKVAKTLKRNKEAKESGKI